MVSSSFFGTIATEISPVVHFWELNQSFIVITDGVRCDRSEHTFSVLLAELYPSCKCNSQLIRVVSSAGISEYRFRFSNILDGTPRHRSLWCEIRLLSPELCRYHTLSEVFSAKLTSSPPFKLPTNCFEDAFISTAIGKFSKLAPFVD